MESSRADQSVNQSVNVVDRWRYRSAVHAARVLNTLGRSGEVRTTVDGRRHSEPQRHVEIPRPRSSGS